MPFETTWPPQQPNQEWLDAIWRTMTVGTPDYSTLRGRALSASQNLATAGNAPGATGVGASTQYGGTGPTVTAVPKATATAQPAATAQPSATAAGGTTSASAPAGTPYSLLATQSTAPTPAGIPPTLNPATVKQIWKVMADQGGPQAGGTAGGTGTQEKNQSGDLNISGRSDSADAVNA